MHSPLCCRAMPPTASLKAAMRSTSVAKPEHCKVNTRRAIKARMRWTMPMPRFAPRPAEEDKCATRTSISEQDLEIFPSTLMKVARFAPVRKICHSQGNVVVAAVTLAFGEDS